MDQEDLGDSMFDSMITWRDYDLVLAIKLETATYPEGKRAPKKDDKQMYQAHRNRIVRAWLAGVDFKNRLQANLEDAVIHRVPTPIVERLRVIMEKKRYKLKINDLTESEAVHSLREAYDEVMREHAVSKQLIPRTALQVRAFNAYDVEMPQQNGISLAKKILCK